MANDLSPSYARIRYHVGTHQHVMTLACKITGTITPGITPDVITKGDGTAPFRESALAFAEVLKPLFPTSAGFDTAEIWSKPEVDEAATFVYAVSLGVTGTGVPAAVVAGELVMTFRTPSRGGLKLYLLETFIAANERYPAPYTTQAGLAALNEYMLDDEAWITGRNNEFPVIGLNATSKINDVLRDKYLIGG